MINRPVIALLGARGAVGEQVIAQLAPVGHLRAGSRQLPVSPMWNTSVLICSMSARCVSSVRVLN